MKHIFLFIAVFTLFNCKPEKELAGPVSKEKITGYVQKGPFISGTEVVLYELNENLEQTGKSFVSSIKDNKGTFQFNNIAISSPFVLVSANGYYFNENTGEISSSTLQLNALLDIRNVTEITINVLTHLEKPRVENLVSQGKSFTEAKKTAQQEILKVFNFPTATINSSEILDISQPGEGNARLLAASVIMQGLLSVGEMSYLLAELSTDLADDGIATTNSQTIGDLRVNVLRILPTLTNIRVLLEDRYTKLGYRVTISDFENLVRNFLGEVVTDVDGNTYASVVIGDQIWMAENLRVTHYKNKNTIPHITDLMEWRSLTVGAYDYYDNDHTNSLIFGNLYNWYAVSSQRGLCPSGWHIPSSDEYMKLIDFANASNNSEKLKSWYFWEPHDPLFDITNETGFSVLPGGRKTEYGDYTWKGFYANYWCEPINISPPSWPADLPGGLNLSFNDPNSGISGWQKEVGASVRCVKD